MPYDVHMLDFSTGETAICHQDGDWDESLNYLWEEGAWSSDHHRHYEFAKAVGRPSPEPVFGCERYFILKIIEDGKDVYGPEVLPSEPGYDE